MKKKGIGVFSLLFIWLVITGFSPVGRNMVMNPGFEDKVDNSVVFWNTTVWDSNKEKTSFGIDTTTAHTGNSSVSITNFYDNDARYTQNIQVKANTNYRITAWVKTEGVGTQTKGANLSLNSISETSVDMNGTSGMWKQIALNIHTAKDQKYIVLTLGLGGYSNINTGKAWFDDIDVHQVSSFATNQRVIQLSSASVGQSATKDDRTQTMMLIILIFLFLSIVGYFFFKVWKPVNPFISSKLSGDDDSSTKTKRCRLDKTDLKVVVGITAVYLVIALFNLGSTKVPETSWTPSSMGESFVVNFGKIIDLSSVYFYKGLGNGSLNLEYLDDSGKYTPFGRIDATNIFQWNYIDTNIKISRLKVIVNTPGAVFNELCFVERNRKIPVSGFKIEDEITIPGDKGKVEKLFDEQNKFDYYHTFKTGMIFDEIYHAKTAFENINRSEPSETSHPPLGKLFISIGILIFGMNPFGWRIVGTLFGAGMIPLMYLFGKKIFNNRFYAFLSAFFIMFDFMHFVQTRIATIDVYGTFFIILMYYFMYDYFMNTDYNQNIKIALKPLLLSGLFFGLASASKWIGIYGGGGLAVILLLKKIIEYNSGTKDLSGKAKRLWRENYLAHNIYPTFLCCIVFFIVIPGTIYLLSYIPYMLVKEANHGISDIITSQKAMFEYHKNLVADHPFKSLWYTWPFDYKPIWYYSGSSLAAGMASSITSMGNPAIWWMGIITMPLSGIIAYYRKDKRVLLILVAAAFQYLPWVFITRITFIYHFFSTTPFMIILTVYVLGFIQEKWPKLKSLVYIYMLITFILFVAFYPVLSGLEVHKAYIDEYLRWFKGSWFF